MPRPTAALKPNPFALFRKLTTVRPQEPKLTIGVDLGTTAVKAVALGMRRGGGLRPVVGQSQIPLTAGQDVDASDAIKAAMSALNLSSRIVNLSVSGQWVIIRIIEMPAMKPAEVKQALPFEAQRYLPFNVQEVIIDGTILGPSGSGKQWVLIVACKKELIERRLDWAKRAGVDVALIDVDALALANAFLSTGRAGSAHQTCTLIDVGAQLTNLVIFQGEIPYLVRDIPWGGEKFIRSAAEQLGIEASALSAQLAKAEASPELVGALKLSVEALVTELQLSFDYFENKFGQPPEAVLVTGGLSQSPTFLSALQSHVTQPVTPWMPVPTVPASLSVAYGLALRS